MTTAREIIIQALKRVGVIGVGQVPSSEDINDAFDRLNSMLDEWNLERLMLYHLVQLSFTGDGTETRTLGPGGQINTRRPHEIASAFVRFNASSPLHVDYPLWVIKAREEYNRIVVKEIQTVPRAIFLDTGYPLATLHVWSVPTSDYQVHLSVVEQLDRFANLSDEIELPPGYEATILNNLTARLFDDYGLPPKPMTVQLAAAQKAAIKRVNVQIPQAVSPLFLLGGRRYDYRSDQIL